MAMRRNIFTTAFMQTGKCLSAWRGWVRDWRRMCYLWEHLDGDGGITIKWNPDGSATISGANVQGGGAYWATGGDETTCNATRIQVGSVCIYEVIV